MAARKLLSNCVLIEITLDRRFHLHYNHCQEFMWSKMGVAVLDSVLADVEGTVRVSAGRWSVISRKRHVAVVRT
jgi:hypothetical protein